MAHHQHVQVLGQRVDRVRPGWVGRRRQHVGVRCNRDDVGCVAAARTLGVVRVDRTATYGCQRGFHVPRLVQGVGVDGHLHAAFVGHRQTGIDRGRRGAPVFVQLEPAGAAQHLLPQPVVRDGVALAKQQHVDRHGVHGLMHVGQVPRSGRDRRGLGAVGRPGAAADDRGGARRQRFVDDLRADQMHVAIDCASGEDAPVARQDLGGWPDDQRGIDARHRVGISRLADAHDAPIAHTDVGLHDPPMVEDECAGDDQIGGTLGACATRLTHRFADHLAAAEHGLVAPGAQITLDLDEQIGVGQTDPVARCRSVQASILGA